MIHQVLKTTFGYDEFRPLQEKIITHTLEGKDSLVVMPTGGGKSMCFQIPALVSEGMALVVSPLIALMRDQVNTLQNLGVKCASYNGLNSIEENTYIERNYRLIKPISF